MSDRTCTVVEDGTTCHRPHHARGMCQRHLKRWQKSGNPLLTKTRPPERGLTVEARFWRYAVPSDNPEDCWEWSGNFTTASGSLPYPQFMHNRKRVRAHNLACEMLNGPRPHGQQARHLCGNSVCVNPNHMAWGTAKENSEDRTAHGRGPGTLLWAAKLEADDVLSIRAQEGITTTKELADEFNVSQRTIRHIQTYQTWTDL